MGKAEPMTFHPGPRPPARWSHASTYLDHFALVTYRVDLDALAATLPPGVGAQRFRFDDGTESGLVSAVPFLDRDFHFRAAPFVKVSCGQINYRAYVEVGGRRGVWFFGTSLDSVFVALPRLAWSMPWHRDTITIEADRAGPGPDRMSLRVEGRWGSAEYDLVDVGAPLERLDGFADLDDMHTVLTDPVDGWYQRRDGRLGHYSVWHEALEVRPWQVKAARFAVLERLGLIAADTPVHSALVQRSVVFDVHTPPRRVS
ncbi:MAG TPA: DUF2071 domain-containing protein [Acidimicrobiales bacterium]